MEPVSIVTTVATALFGILAAVFGGKWRRMKDILKEVNEFMSVLHGALEDNNVTKEEVKAILAEHEDLEVSINALTGGSGT